MPGFALLYHNKQPELFDYLQQLLELGFETVLSILSIYLRRAS